MPGPGMDDADMPFELMHRSGPKVDGLLAGGIFSMRSPPGVMPGLRFLPCQAKAIRLALSCCRIEGTS